MMQWHAHVFQFRVINGLNFFFPEEARIHDVRFFDRADPTPFAIIISAALCDVERNARDAVNFRRGVFRIVEATARTVRQGFNAFRLAEIDTSNQLADNHDVEPLNELPLQCRGICECRKAKRRTQVRISVEPFADVQKARFGPLVTGDI